MKEFLLTYDQWFNAPTGFNHSFDLQFFAAEDEGRTEKPTEKKIREARDKGQVARTQELPQALVIIFGMLVILMLASMIYESIFNLTRYYLSSFSRFSVTQKSIGQDFFLVMSEFAKVLLPIFLATTIAAIIANVMQVGFKITPHPLKPDFKKIKFDPKTIIKKIFFSKQVAMNLFKALFKVAVIGISSYLVISSDLQTILLLPDISIPLALQSVLMIGFKIIIWASALLLLLSIPDFIFQKHEFHESLKMSMYELKQEHKETMGDPHIRARLREMQRELVMKNMINQEVPRADVVVTNPTHYAVALKYDSMTMTAPRVVAKGEDQLALRIRQVAREHDVPMIENRPLARQMYDTLNVGDDVPAELFYAVSLVYAELYSKKNLKQAI